MLSPGGELGHVGVAPAAQELTGAARDHEPGPILQRAQRGQVEMVVVEMRDEHRVQVAWRGGRGPLAAQVPHAGAEHGICQHSHTTHVEEYCRVTEICDVGQLRIYP